MIRLSLGIMSNILHLLSAINRYGENNCKIFESSNIISNVRFEDVVDTACACDWILKSAKRDIRLTDSGRILALSFSGVDIPVDLLRKMLYSYVSLCRPIWSSRLPSGRKEAFFVMTKDEQRCFVEANLMSTNPDIECIKWWDELADVFRSRSDQSHTRIGRLGEQLTLKYEKYRTGKQAVYQAFDSNLVGYDVLSCIDVTNTSPLLIEVKASEKHITVATFILTSNEWNVAENSENYNFYLWHLAASRKLAIIHPKDVYPHIPKSIGFGKWLQVEIPFSIFENRFQPI